MFKRWNKIARLVLVLMAGISLSNATHPIQTLAVTSTVPQAKPQPNVLMCGAGGAILGAVVAAVLGTRICGGVGAAVAGLFGGLTAGIVQAMHCGMCESAYPNNHHPKYPVSTLD